MDFICKHCDKRKKLVVKRRDNNRDICSQCLDAKTNHKALTIEKKLEMEAARLERNTNVVLSVKEAEAIAYRKRRDDILAAKERREIEKQFE